VLLGQNIGSGCFRAGFQPGPPSDGLRAPWAGAQVRVMELDLEGDLAERAYPILASLVTPRPIALVTTLGENYRDRCPAVFTAMTR
jgi:hypothetical protein